ncbi:hypothetical protein [Pseudophaeobacter sp.]|uniref:hypothetical protein n=1 Tax=Pseudophaeobacter sp. TaxID=1971739 RepID=UPI0040597C01
MHFTSRELPSRLIRLCDMISLFHLFLGCAFAPPGNEDVSEREDFSPPHSRAFEMPPLLRGGF